MLSSIANVLFLVGIFNPFFSAILNKSKLRWQFSKAMNLLGLISTLAGLTLSILAPSISDADNLFRFNHLNIAMLVLIQLIAFAVLGYAKTNFQNDADNQRFLFWFELTVLAVMVTVSSNHLLIFWLGWASISLSMHQLLTFYPNRYRAVMAAHKKFIFARTAEILLGFAFLILAFNHNTPFISEILSAYPTSNPDWSVHLASILIAIVALIKCAQLPIHGWLIQVVESPTPVSAILHAGIINLGGFLLLNFAPLLSQSVAARTIILAVAGLTTVLAALIMMTRISIKVRLAWSTLAQMGLMLVECALGLYSLALLHLLAHSFYKAHAFLTSGAVAQNYKEAYFSSHSAPSKARWLGAILISTLIIAACMHVLKMPTPISPWLLLGCALTCVLALAPSSANKFIVLLSGLLMVSSYLLLKSGVEQWLHISSSAYIWQADAWIAILIVLLFTAYLLIEFRPGKTLTRKLFTWLNAGFYLDEWSTNLTLRFWPISLPKNHHADHMKEKNA